MLFAVLSNSIFQRSKPSAESFTDGKETKQFLIGMNTWPLLLVRFEINLTMTFCLMLLILFPAVFIKGR